MKTNLTKKKVEQHPVGKCDTFLWDTKIPMFGVKVTPKGKRVYILQYRAQGRLRRFTIGQHGALTLEEAREQAKALLGQIASGVDPALEAKLKKSIPTMSELAERYMEEHAMPKKKPRSIKSDQGMLNSAVIPALGAIQVNAITREDVSKLHHALRKTPVKANRVLSLLSKMFNLAEQWGFRDPGSNPCRFIQKFKEYNRDRLMTPEELARLGKVLDKTEKKRLEPASAVTALRLLIFTGCRKSEILTLKWDHVDFDHGILRLPDSKTGAKVVPLSGPALEVLQKAVRISGNPFVCPGNKAGHYLIGLQKIWERIRAQAGIEDVRLHDLRHCFASVGAAAGMGLPIIGAILGHKKSSTTERYAHLATDPLKQAADKIANEINQAMQAHVPDEPDKVINLADRRNGK